MSLFTDTSLVIGTLLICLVGYLLRKSKAEVPLPPGPKGLPVIGALLDFPTSKPWETYSKWAKEYGPLTGLTLLGQPIIVIEDKETAIAILDKTGSAIADRPSTAMLEMTGWTNVLACLLYGPRFREYRKHFARAIGSATAVQRFFPVINYRASEFVNNILTAKTPQDLVNVINKNIGAIMLYTAYGINLKGDPGHAELMQIAEEGPKEFDIAANPGWLVNYIPIMQHLPSWFPGTTFKREAARSKEVVFGISDALFQAHKLRSDDGTPIPSLAGDYMSDETTMTEEQISNLKWSTGSFFSAGVDTTASTTTSYFLAMMLHPEVQEKLQREVDTVVGSHRLPELADRPNMPYATAVHKELFRWLPAGPAGVPHKARENVSFGQYVIPNGAMVIANIWGMLHDPAVYKDPFTFNPERHLGPTPEADPLDVAFGFGRRICPGNNIADHIIWCFITNVAATVNVKKLVVDGKVVEPPVEQCHGTVSRPALFDYALSPRRDLSTVHQLTSHVIDAWH